MIGRRLKQLRLARNLSLEALATMMGGMVTKQAIWKYENDKASPSPSVLAKLAGALGVNGSYLLTEPSIRVEFIAYRKSGNLEEQKIRKVEGISVIFFSALRRFRASALPISYELSAVMVR